MPLRNRVDPFGEIHAVPQRGLFTGNRGVIHEPETKTLLKRRWTTKAWIVCDCDFRRRRREVMGRNAPSGKAGWTELFFLDEVTALAAGHRPCFYCRRERATDFLLRYGEAFGIAEPRAPELDARLHRQRLASGGKPPTLAPDQLDALPDGTTIAVGDAAFARRGGAMMRWGFAGYGQAEPLPAGPIRLVTPETTVAVLRAGYRPAWATAAPPRAGADDGNPAPPRNTRREPSS